MQDKMIDFVMKYPIVLIPILLTLPFIYAIRYRRMKRRVGHLNDPKSKSMLVVGLIAAAIIIAAVLRYS
jgi:hypothetical protein